MLSRIADSLFWLSRYMERADGLLRTVRTHYILSLDKDVNNHLTWKPVLNIFTQQGSTPAPVPYNDTPAVLHLLMLDTDNNNSLKVILTRARENARGVQDHITKEVWEQVNQMYHLIHQKNLTKKIAGAEALDVIENFLKNSLLFTGVVETTMPRGTGWNFMNLGRYIERCLQTIEFTDRAYHEISYNLQDSKDIMHWRYLLLTVSGYELHLKTYRSANYNINVLHQLFINEHFTRSVIYTLCRIQRYLHNVADENKSPENEALLRFFGRLFSSVQYVDFDLLNGITLQHFITSMRHNMIECSKKIAQRFFSYS
jgi:uncharacterized alpha-E superfamily protein